MRGTFGGFCHHRPHQPSEVGVLFSAFFAALNLAVIDTVMGHVNVHIDCHLISCYASLCPSRCTEPVYTRGGSRGPSRMRQTHVESLSQSDKTDVANALFNMDTKLDACQSSHVVLSLACVRGFAGVPCFRFFRARDGDEFLRMYSRRAPITFDAF